MSKLIQNAIRTPDGTVLISLHVHDYKSYVDANGEMYVVDGGLEYIRVGENPGAEDLSVTDDMDFEVARKRYLRGGRGKDGTEPLTYKTISEMDDDYLIAALEYNTRRGSAKSVANEMYAKELAYRQIKQLKQEEEVMCIETPKQERMPDTVGITNNGYQVIQFATDSGQIANHKEDGRFSIEVPGFGEFVTDFETFDHQIWKISKIVRTSDGKIFKVGDTVAVQGAVVLQIITGFSIAFDGTMYASFRSSTPSSTAYGSAQMTSITVPRKYLFTTDDGVRMYEGDSWWYIVLDQHLAPRQTSNVEYKGTTPSEQVKTYGIEQNAKAASKVAMLKAPVLSLEDIAKNLPHLANLERIVRSRTN